MIEKITCPVCGSEKNVINTADRYCCLDCDSLWNESRRKPSAVTPEMAWEWFCEKHFKKYPSILKMFIKRGKITTIRQYPTSDEMIERTEYNESTNIVNALGWQSMPERTRVSDEKI